MRVRVRVRVRVGLRFRVRVRVLSAAVVRLVVSEPQQRRALRADLVGARLELGGAAHLRYRIEVWIKARVIRMGLRLGLVLGLGFG